MSAGLARWQTSARPLLAVRPAGSGVSLADEAVELAGRAGLLPDPWQEEALHEILQLDHTGRYAAREAVEIVGRQEGKTTHIGLPRALCGFLLLGEPLIMWSAHEVRAHMGSFLGAQKALARLGEQVSDTLFVVDGRRIKVTNTNGQEQLTADATDELPAQEWKFHARSKGAGRSMTADLTVIDEAFAYTRAQQSALAPTQLAVPNPQTLYLSSPPLDGVSGEVLFALLARAQKQARRLYFRAWGIESTLDELERIAQRDPAELTALLLDRELWYRALPALSGPHVDERAVEDLFDQMDPLDFAREVLGAWPVQLDTSSRVLTAEMMRRTARAGSGIADDGPVAYGFDCTPDRALGAIGVAGRAVGADDTAADAVQLEVIEHRAGVGWIVERAVEIDAKTPGLAWVVDSDSPAVGLAADMVAAGLLVRVLTPAESSSACTGLYDALGADPVEAVHLDDRVLLAAAEAARKRNAGDGGFRWARRSSSSSIAPLVTLTGAWFVVDEWLRVPPPPPAAVPSGGGDERGSTGGLNDVSF